MFNPQRSLLCRKRLLIFIYYYSKYSVLNLMVLQIFAIFLFLYHNDHLVIWRWFYLVSLIILACIAMVNTICLPTCSYLALCKIFWGIHLTIDFLSLGYKAKVSVFNIIRTALITFLLTSLYIRTSRTVCIWNLIVFWNFFFFNWLRWHHYLLTYWYFVHNYNSICQEARCTGSQHKLIVRKEML